MNPRIVFNWTENKIMQWMFSTVCPEHQRLQILHTSNNILRNLGQFLCLAISV